MQSVDIQTDNLVKAIKDSQAYIHYQRAREILSENKELYQRVNEFRKNRFFIQMNQNGNFIGGSEQLQRDYDDLLNNTQVEDFLRAEQHLCKVLRNINAKIFESVNMDIDFLEE